MTRPYLLLVLCLAATVPAGAQRKPGQGEGPPQIMRRVFEMRSKVKFVGVRFVQHVDRGAQRVVKEKLSRDGVRIRIETIDGPLAGQIAVEDNETRRVWSPRENTIREMPARESEFFMRLGKMGGHSTEGRGRPEGNNRPPQERPKPSESDGGLVAGVPTRLLELKTSEGKVINQTWIDPVHGVILKFQNFDRSGKRNGYLEFKSIKFDTPIAASQFTISKPGARIVTPADELKQFAHELGFKPYRLPQSSGWRLVSVRKMEPKGTKVLMEVYRNQRSQVSLFVLQGNLDAERLKSLQGGRTNTHVWDRDGVRMALIGNLNLEGLRRLAQAVVG